MDETARKKALRMVPYGLYLLGARPASPQGPEDHFAYVVSWVTQTSFKPPMLVVCMGRESHGLKLVKESRVLSLSFLGAEQKDLAKTFFKDVVHADGKMSGVAWAPGARTGCPVFPDTPAHVECEVEHVHEGENDHAVVVAKVVDAQHRRDADMLTTKGTGWTYAG